MGKQYSISEARSHLPTLVREVEHGTTVELTRRGKPVAVVLSLREYQRLASAKGDLWNAIEQFRRSIDLSDLDLGPEYFDALRDRSPGRPVDL